MHRTRRAHSPLSQWPRAGLQLAWGFAVFGSILAPQSAKGAEPATFKPRVSRNVNQDALWPAAGDFNGDGRLDLAVGGNSGSAIVTFYTQSDGTLPLTGVSTPSFGATRLRATDFNLDGRSDLLLIADKGMEVRYGQPDKTFSAPTPIGPNGIFTWSCTAIGDLNGDGRPDALATDPTSTTNGGGFYLSYRTPGGDFGSPIAQSTQSSAAGITVADLNRDGHPDVIVGDNFSGLKVAYGSASGAFIVKGFANQDRAYELTAGDFNRDGFPDVAFPAWNHGAIGVMLAAPNGDLGAPSFYPATATADSIASGDFNRDGFLDLVASSESGTQLGVVFGNGDGTFGSLLTLQASANGTSKVTVGDFDGSGFADIAVAAASGSNVDVFYNASVPEPTGLTALLLAGVAVMRPRRRPSSRH